MAEQSYLQWLARDTRTTWWHDSADPRELDLALAHGAAGATTNPVLAYRALISRPDHLRALLRGMPSDIGAEERADRLVQALVEEAAGALAPRHASSGGVAGWVCAQVNPSRAGERAAMLAMARVHHGWAPNVSVKLPVTAAGLDAMEDCVAEGITVTGTISFTVPQVVAVAERHRRGAARARRAGIRPGRCFAVIMIGRLDEYLREVATDRGAPASEADIAAAGLAVTKRAYGIFRDRGYEATLLVAALRATYHMTEIAGAELVVSIHPRVQAGLLAPGVPRETRIGRPVDPSAVERLRALPDFVRAYEPDGMAEEDFLSYGLTQRTLSQFIEAGWAPMEAFTP
jgi:transaldolase